jgi:tRNA dimethylallyltransferase
VAVLGPTCSWKSDVGLLLAERHGGEIISCDSMQVYRDMDIGTAKPDAQTRNRLRHHLVDILDIAEPYSANRFAELAAHAHNDIKGRGMRAILVGGTGLYAKTYLYDLNLLPANPRVFRELESILAQTNGLEELIRELRAGSATTVPADVLSNPRRLLRACEVLRLTGRPPWEHHGGKPRRSPFVQVCILPAMGVLRERIKRRTAAMIEAGWIEETRRLLARGLLQTPTARQALGYRDIARFLENEKREDEKQLLDILVSRTVAYARRQRTWFRNQHPGAHIVDVDDPQTTAEQLADIIGTVVQNSLFEYP